MREFYLCGILAGLLAIVYGVVLASCTQRDRAIVKDVVHLIDDVCSDLEDVDTCLAKMQAHRASMNLPKDAGSEQ